MSKVSLSKIIEVQMLQREYNRLWIKINNLINKHEQETRVRKTN
jgi:hypothetical protein